MNRLIIQLFRFSCLFSSKEWKKACADAKNILLPGDYKLQILSLKLTSDYLVFLPCSSTASVLSSLILFVFLVLIQVHQQAVMKNMKESINKSVLRSAHTRILVLAKFDGSSQTRYFCQKNLVEVWPYYLFLKTPRVNWSLNK